MGPLQRLQCGFSEMGYIGVSLWETWQVPRGLQEFLFFFFTGVSVGPECVFLVEGGANWTLLCMWPHSFYGLLLHPGHLFCPFLFLLNPP